MTISLRPITSDNWRAVYKLTTSLTAEQQKFVAPNAYSMLEALYDNDEFTAHAIYNDETPVGFLVTGYDPEPQHHWVVRLMIGGEHQGKGYGREAMRLILDHFRDMPDCDAVYISFEPENHVARQLYGSFGFLDTGKIEDGEVVYRLPLREPLTS